MNRDILNIVEWMYDYNENADSNGYVIGLSGGVDSALVAALAVKAVGSDNVHGVIIPIESNPDDEKDAIKVAESLDINYDIVNLTNAYKAMINAYNYNCDTLLKSNVKARLRMTMLYQYAGGRGMLVAGTGNRSEDAVGYFTKYGDGGVDILPIAEFYKTEVREMAVEMGLPDDIAFRVSTAGLWPGYEVLDNILMFIDGFTDDMSEKSSKRFTYVLELINKNKHKTEYPPIYKRR